MAPVEDYGLREVEAVSNPFSSSLVSDFWPFPQMFRTSTETLLAYKSSIYPVTLGATWSRGTVHTVYDLNDPGSIKGVSGSGVWHMAELPKGWIMTNGSTTVFSLSHESMFGEGQVVYGQDDIPVKSCCHFKGRVIFGGVSPGILLSPAWKGIWAKWLDNMPYGLDVDYTSSRQNCVYWTTIGGGDVLLPFAPEIAMDGVIEEDSPGTRDEEFFMELLKRNELGLMPMPWQGDVYAVKELGNGIAVYGEYGVAVLTPASDPYPTFGLRIISNFGIAGRNAVGGDRRRHIFVDGAGNAWSLDANYALRKLGYKEFLADIADELVISHDPEFDNFYISGEDTCYILTPQGLGQSPQIVRSCLNTGENLYGIFETETGEEAIVVTDLIDFGYRDLKTVTTVEVGATVTDALFVAVDYRYGAGGDFTRSSWVPVNADGFARVQKTAEDFRIAVKCNTYSGFELDYINVRWQASARRTVRGMNASTANAEPNI